MLTYLVRVIQGLHKEPPGDDAAIAAGPLLFWTYLPLGSFVHRGLARLVANFAIPAEARSFPLLRNDTGTDNTGLVHWWAIFGRGERGEKKLVRHVRILSPEEQRISISQLPSPDYFVELIENQHRPEDDPMTVRSVKHWSANIEH
jgi:hypothetical protein